MAIARADKRLREKATASRRPEGFRIQPNSFEAVKKR
jgi:hypothetical protein